MPRATALAPFRSSRFARLWTGALLSNVGTWMASVAVGILVTERTGKATWTGIAAAAAFLPSALLAPMGGALADRVSRRALLLSTAAIQAVAAGVLALLVATDHASMAAVTLVVFVDGCAGALALPVFTALVPELVPRDDLPNAISLTTAQYNLGRVIGPLLAALVIALAGYTWVFVANAASFVVILLVVLSVELAPPPDEMRTSFGEALARGARFARRDAGMRAILVLFPLYTLLLAPFIALIPAMAIEVLDEGRTGTSVLVASQGIGAILGAVLVALVVRRTGQRRLLLASYVAYPMALVGYALAPHLAWSAATICALGLINATCFSGFITVAQLRAPEELRGRVASLLLAIFGAGFPLAAITQGAIADVIGLRATTAGAAVILAAIFLVLRLVRPGFDADLGGPTVEVPQRGCGTMRM